MRTMKAAGYVLLSGGILIAGCESNSTMKQTALYTINEEIVPVDYAGVHDTNLSYMLEKYDADSDGRIAEAEYDRGSTAFTRLDKNSDGFISDDDFQSGGMQRQMDGMIAQRYFAAYFQDDEENDKLTQPELLLAIDAYDTNSDGTVSAKEFAALSGERKVSLPGDESPMMSRMMGDADPFEKILGQADGDKDGSLTSNEMVTYFYDNAKDEEWTIRNPMGGRRRGNRGGGGQQAAAAEEPQDGAMMGEIAPDFTLSPPDGGETVMLSSFQGNVPVALIFGSYT